MKVYLDNCVLNRPFDDQAGVKVRLETAAVLLIFDLIEERKFFPVNSDVIEYENSQSPFFERKIWISNYLKKTSYFQKVNESIRRRAQELEKKGIFSLDALHIASAEEIKAEYFLTCDAVILRKYKKDRLEVLNPVDFIRKINHLIK